MPRIRTHGNPFHHLQRLQKIALPQLPLDLEIGFGLGHFLESYAAKHPERFILGAEIRAKAVEMVKKRLEPMGMENVHLVHGNGRICLEDMIDDKTLERVFIFHPDPWFKKRHQKRRVVNREFLDLLRRKMTSDGKIYVSTDVEELWLAMTEEFDSAGYRMAEQDPFWQNDYAGQWQRISDDSGRVSHQAIFGL